MTGDETGKLAVLWRGDRQARADATPANNRFYRVFEELASVGIHAEPAVYAEAMALSARAHLALGCRGVSRADLRYDGRRLYMLEVNTQPGMTPTSLVPEQAAYAGISFPDLVTWMVENAECDG